MALPLALLAGAGAGAGAGARAVSLALRAVAVFGRRPAGCDRRRREQVRLTVKLGAKRPRAAARGNGAQKAATQRAAIQAANDTGRKIYAELVEAMSVEAKASSAAVRRERLIQNRSFASSETQNRIPN